MESIQTKLSRIFTIEIFTKKFWVEECNKDEICFNCNLSHCADHKVNFNSCPHAIAMREKKETDLITMDQIQKIKRLWKDA